MLACKSIFARPSMPQPRKARIGDSREGCEAHITVAIIPYSIAFENLF